MGKNKIEPISKSWKSKKPTHAKLKPCMLIDSAVAMFA